MRSGLLLFGVLSTTTVLASCSAAPDTEHEIDLAADRDEPSLDTDELEIRAQALTAGADWTLASEGIEGNPPSTLATDRFLPQVAYASNSSELYVTWSFGERWWRALTTEDNAWLSPPVVDPNRPGAAYVTKGTTLYATRNAGASWEEVGPALQIRAVAPGNSNVLWATNPHLGLQKSTDRGLTWVAAPLPTGVNAYPSCCGSVVANSAEDVYLSTSYDRLFRTRDGGATWSEGTRAGLYELSDFAVDSRNQEVLYATGYDGQSPHAAGLRKSTDGGQTWFRPSAQFTSITPHDVEVGVHDRVYVTYGQEIFVSDDGARTFAEATDGLENTGALWAVVPHRSLRCVAYALTGTGVFRTTNGAGRCVR